MDLSSLSKEELLLMVKKLQKESKRKDEKIAKLEAEKRKLNIKLDELIAKYEKKVEVSNKIKADRFMPKSEKLLDEDKVIDEVESIQEVSKKERKSPSKHFIEDLKDLKSSTVIFDFDFEGNNIDKTKVKDFGEDVTYKIEINPVAFDVVEIKRPKYKDKDKIYQSISEDVFPNSPLTPSLAANIITMKFMLAVPLYRYSKYMNSFSLNISPQDLSNYILRAAEILDPLYNELEKQLVKTPYKVIHGDETPLEVINSEKDKCYMFVYSTSFWDNPIYIYKFSETRKIDNTIELLNDFNGYYICDGYPAYDALPEKTEGKIKIQRCWVHMRRYFYDCIKALGEENKKKSPAFEVVSKINEMFEMEAEMRNEPLTADQIKEQRNSAKYKKILEEIDQKILSIDCGNSTYLEKACKHYKNDKKELYTFLENGYVDESNNLAERNVVRPFVIARSNFMFCKTSNGANVTGKLFSIVQTARRNGLKVEQYLKYVIENIQKKPLDSLLPWSNEIPDSLKINI